MFEKMGAFFDSRLKSQQDVTDNELYHYDTPLMAEHETQTLQEAGFSSVEILNHWRATYTLIAGKFFIYGIGRKKQNAIRNRTIL